MKYWYHFAIMFEALFILTTIDTGTRVARFMLGEFLGRFHKPLERPDWMPGAIITSALVVAGWAYFIRTGSISTIWPMFGIANQLLAQLRCFWHEVIIMRAIQYAWVTLLLWVLCDDNADCRLGSIFATSLKRLRIPIRGLRLSKFTLRSLMIAW